MDIHHYYRKLWCEKLFVLLYPSVKLEEHAALASSSSHSQPCHQALLPQLKDVI